MRKLFLMMALSLSIGLVACGGGSTTETEQQTQNVEQTTEGTDNETTDAEVTTTDTENETTKSEGEQVPAEKKEASEINAADYQQLTTLINTVETFGEKYLADNAAMMEELKAGSADKVACVAKYKEYTEEANAIMEQLNAAEWETEDCNPYLSYLAQGIGSLRAGGEIAAMAAETGNTDLLAAVDTYTKAYTDALASLKEGLGI